jgi:hypothetical protein
MTKYDQYVVALEEASEKIRFLRQNSGLPGPRGNLELVGLRWGTRTTSAVDCRGAGRTHR